jgi:hypothetical protein
LAMFRLAGSFLDATKRIIYGTTFLMVTEH